MADLSVNPQNYSAPWAATNTANTGSTLGAAQDCVFSNSNKKLSSEDKEYVAMLQKDQAAALKSLQEDLADIQDLPPEIQQMRLKSIELQKKSIACLDIEIDSKKGIPQIALKDAIASCKDPKQLNILLNIMVANKQKIVCLEESLATLPEKYRPEVLAQIEQYKKTVS